MTIEDLKKNRIFLSLTDKQQTFVLEYCITGGDGKAAAQKAYDSPNPAALAADNLKTKKIRHVVNLFFGFDSDNTQPLTKEDLQGLLACRLRDKKLDHTPFAKLVAIYLNIAPWRNVGDPDIPTDMEPSQVDDIVQAMEKARKK